MTKHQEVRGLLGTAVWCSAVDLNNLRQCHVLFFLTSALEQDPESITQHLIVLFYDSVLLRLIWGSSTLVYPPHPVEVSH